MSKIYSNDDTITIVSRSHKMRDGAVNLQRFLALSTGITVRDAHRLGVDSGYLRYYVRNGLIEIGAPKTRVSVEAARIAQERTAAFFARAAVSPVIAAAAVEETRTGRRGRRA